MSVAVYWPSSDTVRTDRAIVPGLLAAGWTRRAGRACGEPTEHGAPCAKLGAWGHPDHGVPGRPVCAPHARQRTP